MRNEAREREAARDDIMAGPAPTDSAALKRTPLYDLHVAAGAKMVPFAGYEMPVQYPLGVLKEHLWTREKAGLFDVSGLKKVHVVGPDDHGLFRVRSGLLPDKPAALQLRAEMAAKGYKPLVNATP